MCSIVLEIYHYIFQTTYDRYKRKRLCNYAKPFQCLNAECAVTYNLRVTPCVGTLSRL